MQDNMIKRLKMFIKLNWCPSEYNKNFEKLKCMKGKRAILIGTPIHGNLGDHLIAAECRKFIENMNFDSVIEIPEFQYQLYSEKIYLYPNDTIFISGGGWMGNIWADELVIEDIISRWPCHKIIIFPQTVYFSKTGKYSSSQQLQQVLNKAENLILCVREEQSYITCINELKVEREKCVLLPDMALLRMPDMPISKRKKKNCILISLRDDVEKNAKFEYLTQIVAQLKKAGYICNFTSTVLKKMCIPIENREEEIQKKLKEFSEANLVITDRLHSMIFALLAGTCCVAFDNATHKVSGVYKKWLQDIPGILMIEDGQQLHMVEMNEILSRKYIQNKKDFSALFIKLKEIIENE